MSNKTMIAALPVCAGVAVACGSGSDADTKGPGSQGSTGDTAATDGKKSIVLEVKGPKKADITYGLNADQSQANGAKLPWKKSMSSSEALTIATLSAQNSGSGKITCTITVNGKVVKTNESDGQYSIVTCSTDAL